ncbi:hypothetical protein PZ938_18185 [Luteipulveratus sp. YIM 133132]|uniref:hypothetical protein n=1 Tax=Luteipulveratus flavus TaxID=3031728 RepID=UPI0023AE83A6|nr:hypothetical protein [Luteipulveratus sp. YIM 133132]MDE9367552.1 hypothetical protein [Luteipulveratus sp. YIM 133132]
MRASRSETATATTLLAIGAFQVALAGGAPWGRASYGGAHQGVLPTRLRMVSGVAALGYGTGAALIVSGAGSPRSRVIAFTGLSVLMGIGSATNAASRSPIERAVWTPVSAAAAGLAWRSRTTRA